MPDPGSPLARDGDPTPVASEWVLRLMSGAILAAVALLLTLAGVWAFTFLVVVGSLIATWEWGRLVRGQAFDSAYFVHSGAVVAAAVLVAAGRPLMGLAVLGAGLLALVLVAAANEATRWSLFGMAYIGLPAMALVYLRTDPIYGWHALLLLFAVVWTTDIAAYVAGRNLQGPKLWPSVSPNKTWSGFVAGLAAGALVGVVWGSVSGVSGAGSMALMSVCIALVAQFGDLAESAAKRMFHHKDMSNLIPGHGGLLDRVDSLIFASVAAALLSLIRDADAPGAALMIWS